MILDARFLLRSSLHAILERVRKLEERCSATHARGPGSSRRHPRRGFASPASLAHTLSCFELFSLSRGEELGLSLFDD
jgi:hypothetical protein